jgi:hypothetical protein
MAGCRQFLKIDSASMICCVREDEEHPVLLVRAVAEWRQGALMMNIGGTAKSSRVQPIDPIWSAIRSEAETAVSRRWRRRSSIAWPSVWPTLTSAPR